mgnify:CR=1 FL=1
MYCFSIFTDFLDGYIARKFNAVSGLGKSLDATVDKVFFFGILICLIYLNIFFIDLSVLSRLGALFYYYYYIPGIIILAASS